MSGSTEDRKAIDQRLGPRGLGAGGLGALGTGGMGYMTHEDWRPRTGDEEEV